MGGCASCVGIMALADYDSSYDSYNSYDDGYDYNYDYDFGDTDMWAPEDSYGTDEDASPYGGFTLDEIASVFEPTASRRPSRARAMLAPRLLHRGPAGSDSRRACITWKAPTRSSPTTTCSTGTTAATAR